MHLYFPTVIALAALPFLVQAVPVSSNSSRPGGPISLPLKRHSFHLDPDGRVNHERVQAGVEQTMAKYEQAFSAHEKRTGEIHPLASKRRHSIERRFNSSSLTDFSNTVWTVDVEVGTPPVEFNVQLDTFTSYMFLSGASCLTCFDKKRYDASASQSSGVLNNVSSTLVNRFGLGLAFGDFIYDLVSLGGAVARTPMVVARHINITLQSTTMVADGSFGVGFAGDVLVNGFLAHSWVAELISDGLLPKGQQIFAMVLSGTAPSGPEFILGGTDTSKFVGDLTIVNVMKGANFWQILTESLTVNGNSIKLTFNEVIIDSGTTAITGAIEDIPNIYKNIPGSAQNPISGEWTVPCNTTVDVAFQFNGRSFTIPPSAYILGPASVGSTDGICTSGFVQSENAFWTFGSVFMQNFYVQFDQGNLQVGLAVSA